MGSGNDHNSPGLNASDLGLILRKILDCTGGDIYDERGARAYNGGLGGEPPAGPGGHPWSGGQEPLVRRSGGQSPPP